LAPAPESSAEVRYNEAMGWLVPIGIWLAIALSFFWAGREAQRLRDPARHRHPGASSPRSSRPGARTERPTDLGRIDVRWTEVRPGSGAGRPRPATWDLSSEPPSGGAERPSVSTRRRYAWEDHTTSDRGQFN
jgi:hypothetical protein